MRIKTVDINRAYQWLIQQRRKFPANSDIWHVRFHWNSIRPALVSALKSKQYRLSPMQIVTNAQGESKALWSSLDALVIHYLTRQLEQRLPTHTLCEHIKGHQGGSASIKRLNRFIQSQPASFVIRTDIKGYYANINKEILFTQLKKHVHESYLLELINQYIYYSVEDGGEFHTPKQGIARSSSLSPLLAAFHLYCIDEHFSNLPHCRYARYMDDFIILTKTRWQLRKTVTTLNQFFNQFGFVQHPDKTFIGKIDKGFDWMGVWFTKQGATTIAPRAIQNHRITLTRLYEQTRNLPAKEQAGRVSRYIQRWQQWASQQLNRPIFQVHYNCLSSAMPRLFRSVPETFPFFSGCQTSPE
ncbi:reverse transcriptase domain-containing protein [Vibrio sp. Sgm 5]|uniref:reverse transcriptase domain-containing protein n=1 Tax=Vibrio sp. Sgm 5 TaxID=2994387 RepID=UPI00224981CE|nr:reverse transcriptase domain-containing protein [Vibrio sp. Sgm 5]MCX2790689.1 reverse transcriptase domain-containing protein [Vibrio sp. Sgm 5]